MGAFEKDRRKRITIARQLGYPASVIIALENAMNPFALDRIMKTARERWGRVET